MKKTLLTLALTAACVGAFAQGKINILNDTGHLVYLASDNSLVDASRNFSVQLWGYGGTVGSLALLTSVPMSASIPGIFGPLNWNAPSGIPGGVASTFQVRIFDPVGAYAGQSAVFTMQPGASIAYNSLFNPGGTTLSTWAVGTQAVAGGFGAIGVTVVPEPTSMVLAGLGAASLLLFRRRN